MDRFRSVVGICFAGLVLLLGVACSSVEVHSKPANARIFINNEDTGLSTPAEFQVRSLPTGLLNIEARLQGHRPDSASLSVTRSVAKILFSFWPPALIDFGCDGWKTARPGVIRLDLTPLDYAVQTPPPSGGSNHAFILDDFPIKAYHFDAASRRGSITVDIGGKGFQARLWVVKNIGMICASKNVALEAGNESFEGSQYTISDESIQDGLLTIVFEAH